MVESGPMTDHDPHSEGVAAESFSRQSPVGYTGIVPKCVQTARILTVSAGSGQIFLCAAIIKEKMEEII